MKKSLWLKKLDWNKQYTLDLKLSSNKRDKICYYLVHHVSPITNNYTFSASSLAFKFNCSRAVVFSALKVLRSIPELRISQHHIHFRNYKNEKGGDRR